MLIIFKNEEDKAKEDVDSSLKLLKKTEHKEENLQVKIEETKSDYAIHVQAVAYIQQALQQIATLTENWTRLLSLFRHFEIIINAYFKNVDHICKLTQKVAQVMEGSEPPLKRTRTTTDNVLPFILFYIYMFSI